MLTDFEKLPTLKVGEFTLEIELHELSDEMKDVAKRELRETPELQQAAVEKLKELLKSNNP